MNSRGCFRLAALCLVLGVILFHFTGCTASTPQARAQKNPAMLEGMSAEDQEMVMRSTISEGMSKNAVFLAWGRPDSVATGSENGRQIETWRYATLRPVYGFGSLGLGMGLGYGRSYRHRGGFIAPYTTFPLTPDYVPMTSSVVRFKNGRVIAWETADAPGRRR